MIMVGYSLNGYKLWDKDTGRVVVARNVIFDEKENKEENSVEISQYIDNEYDNNERKNEEQKIDKNNKSNENDDQTNEEINIKTKESQDLGREKRKIKKPKWQEDYVINFEKNQDEVLFALLSGYTEEIPETYEEINSRKDSELWMNAVKEEINVLEESGTWREVRKEKEMKLLDTKWIFTKKKR